MQNWENKINKKIDFKINDIVLCEVVRTRDKVLEIKLENNLKLFIPKWYLSDAYIKHINRSYFIGEKMFGIIKSMIGNKIFISLKQSDMCKSISFEKNHIVTGKVLYRQKEKKKALIFIENYCNVWLDSSQFAGYKSFRKFIKVGSFYEFKIVETREGKITKILLIENL